MGYVRPIAIIVSASYGEPVSDRNARHWIEVAHERAVEIFDGHRLGHLVSPVVDAIVNHERSFLVAWDGSKEGWGASDRGDEARAEFVAWLRSKAYADGSSPLDWVEVQYGGDDHEAKVLAHADEERERSEASS